MSGTTESNTQEFAISGEDEVAILEALKPLGVDSYEVAASDPWLVLLVVLSDCEPDAEQALAQVREYLKGIGRAEPVSRDDWGSAVLPTGMIQIRFYEALSNEAIEDFSKQTGLRVLKRNEFQPKQVAFLPEDADHADLTEAIGIAEKLPEVRRAWVEVLSRYRRL